MKKRTERTTKEVSRARVNNLLNSNPAWFKTVIFVKKDGSIRKMNCRSGVTKFLKGGPNRAKAPGLHTVFDMQIMEYRSFYKDKILEIHQEGIDYKIVD